LQDSNVSIVLSTFKFDAKTGALTDFSRDDDMNAIAQLRDMHAEQGRPRARRDDCAMGRHEAPSAGEVMTAIYIIRHGATIRAERRAAEKNAEGGIERVMANILKPGPTGVDSLTSAQFMDIWGCKLGNADSPVARGPAALAGDWMPQRSIEYPKRPPKT
jgi:hypothetical protein